MSHLLIGLLGLALGLALHPLSPTTWQLVPRSFRSPISPELELRWAAAEQRGPQRPDQQGQGARARTRAKVEAKVGRWAPFGLGTRAFWAARAGATARDRVGK